MQDCLLDSRPQDSISLKLIPQDGFTRWLETQDEATRRWVTAAGFTAKPDSFCLLPGPDGGVGGVIAGVRSPTDPWACGNLPLLLPEGNYHLVSDWTPAALARLAIGWDLGGYQFTRYKAPKRAPARLALDPDWNIRHIRHQIQSIKLVRDLINTPAADMMPEHLGEALRILGQQFGAEVNQVVGADLLEQRFPVVHAVGRASLHPPRLLELRWGNPADPQLTLVGKGVCFDSGGLDLKTAAQMRLMKKDMGGAAHAIGLAHLVMSSGLAVRLRVLIPAVENAVAGNALRPGDVLRSRQGLTIEIHNTDAEGRLILSDALAAAVEEQPALLIDFATLTGAARVALGTELPALFCNDETLAADLLAAAAGEQDPLWRLPLHAPYRELLDSKVADIANAGDAPYAGAITAALFLQEFVPASIPWAHVDLMAWNTKSRPGRPEGGEAMGLRAVFAYLLQRFGHGG